MPRGARAYFISPGAALFHVCQAGPCLLELFGASHLSETEHLFLQLHNTVAQPIAAAIPLWEVLIGPLAVASYTPSRLHRAFSLGCTAALSTTPGLYTAPEAGAGFICTFEGTEETP